MLNATYDSAQEREKFDLDTGKRNIGFKVSEAIMEAIDDSFDAPLSPGDVGAAKCVKIFIYEENYIEQNEVEYDAQQIDIDGNKSQRYSYLILDNGSGTDVDNIFDFGKKKEHRFSTLDELTTINGLFHYGLSSHMNVGQQLYFYSRRVSEEWWLNCLEGSEILEDVYTYKKQEQPYFKIEDQKLELDEPDFYVRTIVNVKGVRKSELEEENLDKYVENLVKQFGITYRHYIQRGNKVFINGKQVKAIDPFLSEKKYTGRGIGSDVFHSFDITLKELLEKEDVIVEKRIINKYGHLFQNKKELLNQAIKVNMFHLSLKFIDTSFKNRITREIVNCLTPSGVDSGFYIKRNNRYIGRAAKILDICTNHNSFNYFRAEIAFSPIFDNFFGIQVNKNKYDIKSSLASLLIDKMVEKTEGKLSSYLKRYKDDPPNNKPSLLNQLKIKTQIVKKNIYQLDRVRADAQVKGVESELIEETVGFIKIMQNIEDDINVAISKYDFQNLTEGDTKEIEEVIKSVDYALEEFDQVLQILNNTISIREEQLIEPADLLKGRLEKAKNNRRLIIANVPESNNFQGYLIEPLNEVETYGALYQMLHHFPNEFEFVLLDYSEAKGLDCVAKIRDSKIYNNLNLKERFENQWEYEWEEYLNNKEGAFSYVELKYLLGEREELGHSMTLVSHLICWDFKNDYNEFNARDGKYILSQDKRYLFHRNRQKKIKVICLREIVERLCNGEFYTSDDDFRYYLSK